MEFHGTRPKPPQLLEGEMMNTEHRRNERKIIWRRKKCCKFQTRGGRGGDRIVLFTGKGKNRMKNDVSRAPCPTHHPSIWDPSAVGVQRIKLQVSWEKCRECREALFESAHSTLPLPLWQGGRGCIGGGSLGRPYFGFSVIRREEERGNATHVGAILHWCTATF